MKSPKLPPARWLANSLLTRVQRRLSARNRRTQAQLDQLLILQGQALAMANAERAPFSHLADAEFKVFSQYGEDGILQYLIREAGIQQHERIFVEFGVQDYLESNTRFLLQNNHWRGLILDGNPSFMQSVQRSELYWRHDLTAMAAWIDRDNINDLIATAGFAGNLGILSIDIDGNDYWIWEAITCVKPVIVVVEWNSVFGPKHPVSVPYNPRFSRSKAHYSCLYWGASIAAFTQLAAVKGYALIGSNQAGNNLFFVRKDRCGRLPVSNGKEAYVEARFRDSRDRDGRLNFLSGPVRAMEIAQLPLVNVATGEMTSLAQLNPAQTDQR